MRLPPKPPLSPKHVEERLKLAAGGLQALALALFGGVLVAPLLNASMSASSLAKLLAFLFCGGAEIAAFILLHYIPGPSIPKDPGP